MIETFKISNVASFDEQGIEVNDLKEVNFIYGANGCGKTTISNYLLFKENSKFNSCSVSWKNERPIKTLVYNKAFKDKILFREKDIPGIFTLGEEGTETAKEVERIETIISSKNNKIASLIAVLEEKKEQIKLIIENFQENCWERKNSTNFKEFQKAFSGYNNSKAKFAEKIISVLESDNSKEIELVELKKSYLALYDREQERIKDIEEIRINLEDLEKNTIFREKIIGKNDVNISKLINKLDNADWVNQGLAYVNDENEICPFCQQSTLKPFLKKQLNDFFDETYNEEISKLKIIQENYQIKTNSLLSEIKEKKAFLNDSKAIDFDLNLYEQIEETIKSKINENKQSISNKIKNPSKEFILNSLSNEILKMNRIISSCAGQINKFNDLIEKRNEKKPDFVNDMFSYIALLLKDTYIKYVQKLSDFQKAKNNLTQKISEVKNDIEDLKKEKFKKVQDIVEVESSVIKINKLLKEYGFTNFELARSDEKSIFYKIVRDSGEEAKSTLSEGELTFITFLYYYQLTKGDIQADGINEDRILIIDDPVSSLDSNVLHIVSSLIKQLIKDVKSNNTNLKQIILLTHNIYFHKEVTYREFNSTYWILRKIANKSKIRNFKKNPIKSSYELLWSEIRDNIDSISLQNNMRRILEYYFKIIGDNVNLLKAFKLLDESEERIIANSLISWTNDGSHNFSDEMFVQTFDNTNSNYKKVFEKLFLNAGHEAHYKMMMRIGSK